MQKEHIALVLERESEYRDSAEDQRRDEPDGAYSIAVFTRITRDKEASIIS